MSNDIRLEIYRREGTGEETSEGKMVDYTIPATPGMVVLDAVHEVQARHAPDLAVRWNCKAGKCGSCSAEVNGHPKLMCMDRVDNYKSGETISIRPLKSFPVIKDLVTDVSWNYEVNKRIPEFAMREADQNAPRFTQEEADRVQEFRKCIECFLCQDVCHVVRDHQKTEEFGGPRFLVRAASLEMHPLDTIDRIPMIKKELGVGYCNITKCCTEVCPENISITDNAIIPLKERVVDRYYDPVQMVLHKIMPSKKRLPADSNNS